MQRPSDSMLQVLKERGFTAGTRHESGLVQLQLPSLPDLDAWSAQRLLQDLFPQGGFGLNYVYKPYHSAAVETGAAAHPIPMAGQKGCPSERCYGPALVKWQPHLAACATGTTIGVIDTGIDKRHPAFAGRKVTELRLSSRGVVRASAAHAHGTGVLSLLAGAPGSSTPGLVPDAQFLIVDVFFTNAEGQPETDSMRLVEALMALDERGAQIVNMSLVGPKDDLVHQVISAMATRKGVVFVAAAGNGGPDAPPGYPAAYRDEVIAVTAVDRKGASYVYANRGDYIDIAAPGVKIWTALPGHKEGAQSGTSFAAPFVTAAIAAAYKDTPLTSRLTEGGRRLDPKGAMLARLLGDNRKVDLGKRHPIYGLGLLQAPSKCGSEGEQLLSSLRPTPAPQGLAPAAAQAPMPPAKPVAARGWRPTVNRVALPVEGRR